MLLPENLLSIVYEYDTAGYDKVLYQLEFMITKHAHESSFWVEYPPFYFTVLRNHRGILW